MSNHLRDYANDYSVLAMILATGLVGVILFRMDIIVEQVVIWGLSAMYVLWGIVHHVIRKDLTGFIVLEYVLIGAIAGFIVSAVVTQK